MGVNNYMQLCANEVAKFSESANEIYVQLLIVTCIGKPYKEGVCCGQETLTHSIPLCC